MNAKKIIITMTVMILFATGYVSAQKQDKYLKAVTNYADALLEHGRDTYGDVKSPLIASALDRSTLSLIDKELRRMPGIRNGDRSLYGANVMHDQDLYQLLYGLTTVTGDKKYADEADKSLGWFFKNCQSPNTGLMAWGEHIGWGFKVDSLAFARGGNHEFYVPWVLWEKSFALAPDACITFAKGLWDHQIHEHSGNFSRHANFTEHGTGTNNEYPRHGGFYIASWGEAYNRTKDPVFLKAIETLVDYFNAHSSKITGAIPCSSNPSRINIMWPESNLSLAVDLWDVAEKVPAPLGRKLKQRALKTDKVYLSLAHEFAPAGRGFVAGADVNSLERFTKGAWTDTKIWATAYGKSTDAQVALLCNLRYQQVKMDGYRKLVLDAASRYLYTEPDTSVILYPGALADGIFIMLVAYDMTGQKYYLDRAEYFADSGLRIFMDDSSPLPKASSEDEQYETITGSDDLMLAILDLWVAKNNPKNKPKIIYNHR
ncbi:MAG: hypothetical protein ACYSWP_10300 [Planctomycetota bacterium]|jgi:hypothetical protein